MPLDAISLRAVVEELRPQLLNLRIDKVQQPARDQVILLLRGNKRLLLNAGANAPRLQLTELLRDNPAEPPMFCMLLRKHLVGARVAEITQPGLERLVRIELDVTDDFGQPGHRTLVLEAMGRRSNLILLDGENRVIDCMRRVDAEMSAARQVLPGLFYEPPASTGRLPFLEETEEGLAEKLAQVNPEIQLDRFLLDAYFGHFAPDGPGTQLPGLRGNGRTALQSGRGRKKPLSGRFLCICKLRKGKPIYADRSETGGCSL